MAPESDQSKNLQREAEILRLAWPSPWMASAAALAAVIAAAALCALLYSVDPGLA